MSSANKAKGTAWESLIVRTCEEEGIPAERIALAGSADRGDVLLRQHRVVVEAKNCKALDLAGWVAEAELEASRHVNHDGCVWHKKRGKSSPLDGYVTMTGDTFVSLLRRLT